jgi:hypothetical protein
MISKKVLNSTNTRNNHNSNNQVIIHTEINNYRPLKEYIINLNEIVDSYNQKYKRNISPENFIISREKYSRNKNNEYNEQIFQKQLNNFPFSKFNNTNNNKFSTQLIKPIKPYKKKSILFNQKKIKEKYNNIQLNMSNYSETINSICLTERTLDRTKHSFLKEDNSSFININEDKSNIIYTQINKYFFHLIFSLNIINNIKYYINIIKKKKTIIGILYYKINSFIKQYTR